VTETDRRLFLWNELSTCLLKVISLNEATEGFYFLIPHPDYTPLIEAVGDSRIVMIGEASHGTHEFYAHRYCLLHVI
jgi:hypothetical protein